MITTVPRFGGGLAVLQPHALLSQIAMVNES
jgi:antitoxin component of MazEF toxin-antitoxin module